MLCVRIVTNVTALDTYSDRARLGARQIEWGTPPFWVILFGDIPTVIPSTFVVDDSDTFYYLPIISFAAPVVENDSLSHSPLLDLYVATVARWRSRVTTRLSSSSEFPISLVTYNVPHIRLGIRRRSAILIRPGEAIPFGRPYRTHLNGPHKFLTAKKRVRPLPARRLAWRHASPRSSDHHSSSSSSSSDSLPVHYLGLDTPDQAHSGSSPRDVSPRLGYPPRRAPRCSEAFRRWCAALLSTWYPPTTSESSSGDSSERPLYLSSHFAGPSRKRCSYSSEASIEEDTKIDPIETEVNAELGDTVEVGIDPMLAPIVKEDIVEPAEENSSDSSGTRDGIVRSFEDMPIDLDDTVRDFYHHMSEVRIDRIVGIETAQRRLEADQLIARGQRVSMIERIDSLRLENLKVRAMLDIERDRVNSLRLHMSLSQEEFC
ncbi:hypothetical protein Tco_1155210 [Tanacetum coccineum]